jgi:hypothetical protein
MDFETLRKIIEGMVSQGALITAWEQTFVFEGHWNGRLSPKQSAIADRIVAKLEKQLAAAEAPKIDVSKLFALADSAVSKGAKRISFKLNGEGDSLKYSAKYDNFTVFRGEYPFSTRVLTICRSGEVDSSDATLLTTAEAFAADPVRFALSFGNLIGNCMFCARALNTKESVGVGYGPICAAKFGLPWGSTSEYDAMREELVGA